MNEQEMNEISKVITTVLITVGLILIYIGCIAIVFMLK
jgi:hypothetical protein